jgi:hypothetical protein
MYICSCIDITAFIPFFFKQFMISGNSKNELFLINEQLAFYLFIFPSFSQYLFVQIPFCSMQGKKHSVLV